MINANVSGIPSLLFQFSLYEFAGGHDVVFVNRTSDLVPADLLEDVLGWLKISDQIADSFEVSSAKERSAAFRRDIEKKRMTFQVLSFQCKALREAFEEGFKGQLVYRYPRDRAKVLMNWMDDWKPVSDKFPSTSKDIVYAVDCWALGHSTASVFHSMRILEYGIAALAADVGRDVGTHNWQNLIDQIESAVREQGKTLKSGTEKAERLQFLSQAAKEMAYFKDGWRNHVSHNRATYDDNQAHRVLTHVRTFMSVLATQLSEKPLLT